MGNIVQEILDAANVSVLDAAAYSGIPKSNIYRYLNAEAEPTIAVIQELCLACNLKLETLLLPLSDPNAAEAVKHILGASQLPITKEIESWIHRIERKSPQSNFEFILFGGRASNPLNREGATFYRTEANALTIASAGEVTGKPWALSGAPVLEALDLEVLTTPTILWAEDSDAAVEAFMHSASKVPQADGANVVIVPAHNGELENTTEIEGIKIVSVLQGLLDVVSLSEEVAQQVRFYLEEVK